MNFLRACLYVGLFVSVILGWELIRDEVTPIFQETKVQEAEDSFENENLDGEESVIEEDSLQSVESNSEKSLAKKLQSEQKNEEVKTEIVKPDSTPTLINFETGFENVAKKAMHSVVNVATIQLIEQSSDSSIPDVFRGGPFDDMLKDFFNATPGQKKTKKATALGSGFIVKIANNTAYIVTNNHVVEKAKKIVIFLSDKTELSAVVHAIDQRTDIAVLAVDLNNKLVNKSSLKSIDWGNSDTLSEGNFVVAIGNPFGFGSTVTNGIVSAKGRSIPTPKSTNFVDDFIQHSAPINMGNSGGCLLDIHGKVIGINNAIFSTSGGNIGIGFAIPSNLAKNVVDQLIDHKRTFRGWIGTEIQQVNSKQAESIGLASKTLDSSKIFGAFVARIVPEGPAQKAGIKVGDIIIEFDGKKISEKWSLQSAVGSAKIGSKAKIKIWRQKEADDKWVTKDLELLIGDYERAMELGDTEQKNDLDPNLKETDVNELGISVALVPDRYKDKYPDIKVIVTKVDESQDEFSMFGTIFLPGDGIISANNKNITSVDQLKSILKKVRENPDVERGDPIPFVIYRNGSRMMVATSLVTSKIEKKIEKKKKSRFYAPN